MSSDGPLQDVTAEADSAPPTGSMPRRRALAGIAAAPFALAGAGVIGGRACAAVERPVLLPDDFRRADNATDDARPIQAAIERAAALGGATIRLTPGKVYRLESIAAGSEVSSRNFRSSLALPPRAEGVTLDLNGATLLQVADAFTFGTRFRMFNDRVMERTRIAATAVPVVGADFVDLAAAGGLGPGSRVMLVAGNISRRAYIPIAEMFAVTAVEGNRIFLDRPIGKDHALAEGSLTGAIDITDHYAGGFALLGPGKIVNEHRRAGHLVQLDGCVLRDVEFEGCGGFSLRGRNLTVENHTVSIAGSPGRGRRPYALAFDTGSSEIVVDGLAARGRDFCYLHLHEGLRDVRLRNVVIRNGTRREQEWGGPAAISLLGLSWQVRMTGIRIHGNPQGAGLVARASGALPYGNHDLVLEDISLSGEFRQHAVIVDDPNVVQVAGLDVSQASVWNGRAALMFSGADHRLAGLTHPG
jgi:hypothetical protein